MKNLEQVISRINGYGISSKLWIDGSFLTEKLNPDDVDMAMSVTFQVYSSMTPNQRAFFDDFRSNSLYFSHRIDNYGLVVDGIGPKGHGY